MFALIVDLNVFEKNIDDKSEAVTTHSDIRKWVSDNLDITVSNSSIGRVMEKCGIDSFEKKQKCIFPSLKSEKEKAILTAFKEMNIIVKKIAGISPCYFHSPKISDGNEPYVSYESLPSQYRRYLWQGSCNTGGFSFDRPRISC